MSPTSSRNPDLSPSQDDGSIEAEEHNKVFGIDLAKLTPTSRLVVCVGGTFAFYLIYGYLQEKIFSLDGFEFGWYTTLVQFASYTLFADIDRRVVRAELVRKAPLRNYLIISFFMVATMGLSNTSLEYLNYPTQVLFKSCKLIPVMIGGIVILRKKYSILEYTSAIMLSAGLCELTLGNAYSDPISFNALGVLIISCALLADAFLGNLQEKTLQQFDVSSREMVYYSHIIGCGYLLAITIAVGQFGPAFKYCWEFVAAIPFGAHRRDLTRLSLLRHPEAYFYMVFFSGVGYIGVTFVLALIKMYGAFVAVTVTSCRKFVTLGLSFVIFPKPITIHYYIASVLVFIGISCHVYAKNHEMVDYYVFKLFGVKVGSQRDPSNAGTADFRKFDLPTTVFNSETPHVGRAHHHGQVQV